MRHNGKVIPVRNALSPSIARGPIKVKPGESPFEMARRHARVIRDKWRQLGYTKVEVTVVSEGDDGLCHIVSNIKPYGVPPL